MSPINPATRIAPRLACRAAIRPSFCDTPRRPRTSSAPTRHRSGRPEDGWPARRRAAPFASLMPIAARDREFAFHRRGSLAKLLAWKGYRPGRLRFASRCDVASLLILQAVLRAWQVALEKLRRLVRFYRPEENSTGLVGFAGRHSSLDSNEEAKPCLNRTIPTKPGSKSFSRAGRTPSGGTTFPLSLRTCLLYTSPSPRDRQKSR